MRVFVIPLLLVGLVCMRYKFEKQQGEAADAAGNLRANICELLFISSAASLKAITNLQTCSRTVFIVFVLCECPPRFFSLHGPTYSDTAVVWQQTPAYATKHVRDISFTLTYNNC